MSQIVQRPLGEIAALQAGVGFPLSMQGKTAGRYPFAKVGDISRGGRSGSPTLGSADHFVDEADLASLRAKPIPKGSVLFAKIGEAIRQNHRVMAGCDMLVDNNAMAAIPRTGTFPTYLYHFLRTVDLYPLASTTTVPSLRKTDLERIPVPFPPLDEQRRIAEVLDRAEALRAKRRAALAQLDTLTQSIFLDLFGDPIANPRGWPTLALAQVLAMPLRNGLSPSHGGTVNAKVLTLSAITGNRFNDQALKTSTFLAPPPADQSVSVDDFLICRGNGNVRLVGRGYFPHQSMSDVTFPDTMIAARVAPGKIERAFLQHVWNSTAVRRQVEALARTTNGTFKVNQTVLEGIRFVAPPLALQKDFGRRFAAVEGLKSTQRRSLAELDALFASLQHRAFRGEL